jgi:hypothetical protein
MTMERDLDRPAAAPSAFKARIVAGTALVLLFGSGIVVGFAWDQTANARTVEAVGEDDRPESDGPRRRLVVDNVGLSIAQKAAVDSLVVFHRQRMSDLEAEFRPRHRAVFADLRAEIKEVLTDDQRAQYEVLLAERDAERAERRRDDSKK